MGRRRAGSTATGRQLCLQTGNCGSLACIAATGAPSFAHSIEESLSRCEVWHESRQCSHYLFKAQVYNQLQVRKADVLEMESAEMLHAIDYALLPFCHRSRVRNPK